MAKPSKVTSLPGPAGYAFVDLEGVETVHVPLTQRTYELKKMTVEQAEQLFQLSWPHIQKQEGTDVVG